jgi:uncharacterized damage-inducible protein DinB
VADALLVAARDILDDSLRELLASLDGLDADALNARPSGDDTNALAVVVTHALASTRSWLSLAAHAPPPPRDRPAEFLTAVTDGNTFREASAASADGCRRLLADVDEIDPDREGTAPWRGGAEADEPVSAAWALLHALEHLREHVGHAQLTRQLLDR